MEVKKTVMQQIVDIQHTQRHHIILKSCAKHLHHHQCHLVRTLEIAPKLINIMERNEWPHIVHLTISTEGIAVQIHRHGKKNWNDLYKYDSESIKYVFVILFEFWYRYNKGQSPLLLRRNLLEYGSHQVAPSPLLPRRYTKHSKFKLKLFSENF